MTQPIGIHTSHDPSLMAVQVRFHLYLIDSFISARSEVKQ